MLDLSCLGEQATAPAWVDQSVVHVTRELLLDLHYVEGMESGRDLVQLHAHMRAFFLRDRRVGCRDKGAGRKHGVKKRVAYQTLEVIVAPSGSLAGESLERDPRRSRRHHANPPR
jgi:hypothetical protein